MFAKIAGPPQRPSPARFSSAQPRSGSPVTTMDQPDRTRRSAKNRYAMDQAILFVAIKDRSYIAVPAYTQHICTVLRQDDDVRNVRQRAVVVILLYKCSRGMQEPARVSFHRDLHASISSIMLSFATLAAYAAVHFAAFTSALPHHYPLIKRDIGGDLGPQLSPKAAIYTQSDSGFSDQSARWSKENLGERQDVRR